MGKLAGTHELAAWGAVKTVQEDSRKMAAAAHGQTVAS
ncbi:hypothetical protein P343_00775 [Sporolactobacillus laevolacticus DSM 442]|uniref:Uncharacterized protein n=1 Tax=Sporolactobacillus laevolacticus DSM 442 TaxID=1395513 RepID=V6J1B3_9BACL|nr:hypothetical protein P343_00775 [Sporolactobacillus laevolacticus DSM 442]